MFEIEGHKSTIMGLALGGISGFLLHKNLKLSKGYGIAIGSLLGLIVGFQITKAQAKKARELSAQLRNMGVNTTTKNFSPRELQVRESTIEEQIEFKTKFYKTLPDSFTLDNVNYTKNSNLEFYKQPFTPNTFSGVQPIKISSAEFSNAYNKFKNIGKDLDYFQKVK
jgi:hypothetical protein